MATKTLSGDAPTVAQVNTVTPATVETGDIFAITLGNHAGEAYTLTHTASAATVKDVVDAITVLAVAAASAGTAPWDEVTVTDDDTANTITADTAGVPFWVTTSTTDGGGNDTQTLTDASVTAVSGPSIYGIAENWDGNVLPVSTDDVRIPAGQTVLIYGEDDSAVLLASFHTEDGNTINIGSDAHPLKIDSDDTQLNGTGTCYIESINGAVIVRKSGSGGSGTYALHLRGSGNSAVDIQVIDENNYVILETGTWTDVRISNGTVKLTENASHTDVSVQNGTVVVESSSTDIRQYGGVITDRGGTDTILDIQDGTCYIENVTTIGTATIKGIMDKSRDLRGITITNTSILAGGTINDPQGKITHTNGIDLQYAGLEDVSIYKGTHFTIALSSI